MSDFTDAPSTEVVTTDGDVVGRTLSAAHAEDFEYITEFVPASAIKALTEEFISVTIVRTPYARVSLAITYHDQYPHKPPGVELTSPSLPFALLRKLEKDCVDAAIAELVKRNAGEAQEPPQEKEGKVQAQAQAQAQAQSVGLVEVIYSSIHKFIHTNLFVPCWKEMKQLVTMCTELKHPLQLDEKKGLLSMRLCSGEYRQGVKITVPEAYPDEAIKVSSRVVVVELYIYVCVCV